MYPRITTLLAVSLLTTTGYSWDFSSWWPFSSPSEESITALPDLPVITPPVDLEVKPFVLATQRQWNIATGGNWDTATNWLANGVPNNPGDIAVFSDHPTVAGPTTISASASSTFTIGVLFLDAFNTSGAFTINSNVNFNFDNSGQTAAIDVENANGNVAYEIQGTVNIPISLRITQDCQNPLVMSGIISGGSIDLNGSQTTFFTAANLYTGSTTVDSGVLTLNHTGGPAIVGDLIINGGGTVNCVAAANQLGTATTNLTINGGGKLNISANQSCVSLTQNGSSFDAGTHTLSLSSASPISLTSSTLTGNVNLTFAGNETITVNNNAAAASNIAGGTITTSGHLFINVAPVNNFDLFTIGASIANGPVTKTGQGTWVVVGAGVSSFPPVEVAQGTLSINSLGTATFTNISIDPGATLSIPQSASFTATTIVNNGLFSLTSQQDSGVFNITGSYTQAVGGNLNLNIANTHASAIDKLHFSGTANLNGTLTVNLDEEDIVIDQDLVTFLVADGGVTGTFPTISTNFPSGLGFDVGYTANSVFLLFHGNHIPSFNFLQSSGYMNFSTPLFALNDEHNLQMVRRCAFMRSRLTPPKESSNKVASLLASASDKVLPKKNDQISVSHFRNNPEGKPLSLYVAPLGSRGHFSKTHHQNAFHYRMMGGLLGADYAFTHAGIGAQIGYEHLHAHVNDHWGRFDINNVFGRFYGTFKPLTRVPFFIDASVGSGAQWYDVDRSTTRGTAHGKPHGWEWDAYMGFGYDEWVSNFRFTPLLAFQSMGVHLRKYHEHDAGTHNLIFPRHHMTSLRSDLGMSIGGKLVRRKITWLPEVRGYWQHEYLGHSKRLTIGTPLTSLTTQIGISGLDRNYGIIGTEQRFLFNDRWSLSLDYDYQWSRHQESNDFLLELSVYF